MCSMWVTLTNQPIKKSVATILDQREYSIVDIIFDWNILQSVSNVIYSILNTCDVFDWNIW